MRNSMSDRRFASDVEITLAGDFSAETQFSVSRPNVQIPNEVFIAGPQAVDAYRDFIARVGAVSPVVEHVALSCAA